MEPTRDMPCFAATRRIDLLCDDFEARWSTGKKPRLEEFVESLPEAIRADGLRALLAVEWELLVREGRTPVVDEYQTRFPEHRSLIAEAFASVRRIGDKDTSVSGGAGATGSFQEQPGTLPASRMSEPPPASIGRFKILSILGEGGFGTVYKARDPQLDREVAIKVPKVAVLGSDFDAERFLREAKTAARLRHPNICPVYEVGMENERLFIVMAFVEGQTLADHLKARKSPMPPRQIAKLVQRLALALQAAHDKGIVHRDLKPSNVLIDRERSDVIITDFGLARRPAQPGAVETQSGIIMGTPAYMAPEQARGEVRAIGPRTDVYSLGVILYELLSGRRPFGGTVGEVIGQVIHVEPEPPSKVRPDADPRLEAICLKAMAKDPAARYGSMRELADALVEYVRGGAPKPEPSPASPSTAGAAAPPPALQEAIAELMTEPSAGADAASEAAPVSAGRGVRPRMWAWLLGICLLGASVVGSVIYFSSTPTVQVVININNFGVDLTDKSFAFFFDGQPISAEELKAPMEVKVGDHEVVVKRGDEVVRRFTFVVRKDAGPRIELREEDSEVKPPAPAPSPKIEKNYAYYSAGKWQPMIQTDDDLASTAQAGVVGEHLRLKDGVLDINRGTVIIPVRAANMAIRGKFQNLEARGFSVLVRCIDPITDGHYGFGQNGYNQFGAYRIGGPKPGWSLPTISVTLPRNQPFEFMVVADGAELSGFVNGQRVLHGQDTAFADGHFGLYTDPRYGRALVRELEYRILDERPLPPFERPDPDRRVAHWILARGGHVRLAVGPDEQEVETADKLPKQPFEVLGALLNDREFQDADLKRLHGPKRLATFSLRTAVLTDSGFNTLVHSFQVQVLDISKTKVSETGLKQLSVLPKLQSLHLGNLPASDDTLATLKNNRELELLSIPHSKVTNAGLAHLVVLPKLVSLDLSHCSITDEGLAYLQMCRRLKHLTLTGTKVTTEGVRKLQVALPNCKIEYEPTMAPGDPSRAAAEFLLKNGAIVAGTAGGKPFSLNAVNAVPPGQVVIHYIEGSRCNGLTDKTLAAHAAGLTKLKRINGNDMKLTGTGFGAFRESELDALDMHAGSITDAGLEALSKIPTIAELAFPKNHITDAGLKHLPKLPKLWNLDLNGNQITDAGAAELAKCAGLGDLGLDDTGITDAGLAHLSGLNLHTLSINRTQVTGAGLQHLRAMARLNVLWAGFTKITDAGLEHLGNLKNLTHIDLRGTTVTDAGLQRLKGLNIAEFWLLGTKISDAGLEQLKNMDVSWLGIGGTEITGAGLVHLKKKLTILRAENCKMTDAGLEHLKDHKELWELGLANTKVTDAGLAHLRGLTKMRNLNLNGTAVTDASLENLKDMKALEHLSLGGTKVTDAGVAELKKALPKCQVHR